MNKLTSVAFPALLLLTACGGGVTQESLMEQGMKAMDQMATLMAGIKDEASAKAAAPQIEKLAAQMADLKAQSEKLPKLSPEAEKKMAERGQAAAMKLMEAAGKMASDPKIGAVLGPVMEKLGKSMK
jgi:chemotaxis protein histidine kinase CheA